MNLGPHLTHFPSTGNLLFQKVQEGEHFGQNLRASPLEGMETEPYP